MPAVVAIDRGDQVVGGPCFVMEFVEGRSLSDQVPGGFHTDEWLVAQRPETQRAVWDSFHDQLAAMHRVDATKVPEASHGPNGLVDVIDYWRASLLDAAEAAAVPRQLALLDWLAGNLPSNANDAPGVCMGDARIVNCLIVGFEARALVDFEVAYVGNPAADVGYSLFTSGSQAGTCRHRCRGSRATTRRGNDGRRRRDAASTVVTTGRRSAPWSSASPPRGR